MAVWLFSHADFDRKPHIIIDYKDEDLFERLRKVAPDTITELSVSAAIPKKPGVYIVHPRPKLDDDAIGDFLWRVWERQRTGVYIDECHLLPNDDALKACLVTGRSRQIPLTIISQRPVWVPREAFSEANHHIAFDVSRRDDRKTAGEFMMRNGEPIPRYENHYSLWHDVVRNRRFAMMPPPKGEDSVKVIAARAPRRLRWF